MIILNGFGFFLSLSLSGVKIIKPLDSTGEVLMNNSLIPVALKCCHEENLGKALRKILTLLKAVNELEPERQKQNWGDWSNGSHREQRKMAICHRGTSVWKPSPWFL